ncbi:hypothetical protein LINPERPRIM_LOCUS37171 [Linum perenne]
MELKMQNEQNVYITPNNLSAIQLIHLPAVPRSSSYLLLISPPLAVHRRSVVQPLYPNLNE